MGTYFDGDLLKFYYLKKIYLQVLTKNSNGIGIENELRMLFNIEKRINMVISNSICIKKLPVVVLQKFFWLYSNCEPERIFSQVNLIKNDTRYKLLTETIDIYRFYFSHHTIK